MPAAPHATLMAQLVFIATLVAPLATASAAQAHSADDGACEVPQASRAGSAMMQSKMNTKSAGSDAPLQGRITTALAEVSSLQSRVAAIMAETGLSGTGDAGGAMLLKKADNKALQTEALKLYARYKELLHTKKYEESTIKEDVSTLETEVAGLKSNVLMLENQVQGDSLAQVGKHAVDPTSLKTRVEAVEKEISETRTRVTSLEQVVAGLQTKSTKKAEKASLMQTSSRTGTRLGPLSARLSALEKEVESLTTRSDTLETTIQGSAGGLLQAVQEDAEEGMVRSTPAGKPAHKYASLLQGAAESGEGTIKERTAALEQSVAGLKSKMAMLENEAVGKTSSGSPLSLLQAEAKGSGSSLKARITSLEDEVDSLRTRVTTLEHVVEG